MRKTIKIEFQEQSKAVVAITSVEYILESEEEISRVTNDTISTEAQALFDKNHSHAVRHTMNKPK
jgi:hypothetical protein